MLCISPMAIMEPNKAQKKAIDAFMKTGRSGRHSSQGYLLSAIIMHCQRSAIPFTLYFMNGSFFIAKGIALDQFNREFP